MYPFSLTFHFVWGEEECLLIGLLCPVCVTWVTFPSRDVYISPVRHWNGVYILSPRLYPDSALLFLILEALTCVFMLLFLLIPFIFSIHSLFLSQSRFGKHSLLPIFLFSVQRRWVAEKSGDKSKSKQFWSYTRNYTEEQNWRRRRRGEGRRCNMICRERQKILPPFLSWL